MSSSSSSSSSSAYHHHHQQQQSNHPSNSNSPHSNPTPGPSNQTTPHLPSYRPRSTIYPPTQPAPLFLEDEDDFDENGRYIDSALLSVNDPDYRLRLTRSATETIHEAISEDDRRRKAKKKRLGQSSSKDPLGARKRFQRRSRPPTANSNHTRKSYLDPKLPPLPIAPDLDPPPLPSIANSGEGEDEHTQNLKELEDSPATDFKKQQKKSNKKHSNRGPSFSNERRSIYVNLVLPTGQIDRNGDPLAKYVRNKVRTTKYTIISFLPKNLFEQFRNVANIYFLVLVIFQNFPIFGAATPQVAMLPLLFILCVTGAKDCFEDYRRYMLDNSVNNSPCTRLGDWRNVNVPRSGGGSWWENLDWPWETHDVDQQTEFSGQHRTKITKGVRKLREREKGTFNTDFLRESNSKNETGDLDSDSDEGVQRGLGEAGQSSSNPSRSVLDAALSEMNIRSESPIKATSSIQSRQRKSSSEVVDYSTPTSGTAKWERTLWKKLEVGDIVLLREDEAIPADLVILSSSDPDGQCFVETKNLDGETNLKPRKSIKSTKSIANEEDLEHSHFLIDSEPPNANLYAYNATLKYWTQDEREGREHPLTEGRKLEKGSEKREVIGINEMLLRGCTLRNTQWVMGLVVFTGKDTKIMLNQGDTPSKKAKISDETNYAVIINFVILVVLCAVNAIGDGIYSGNTSTSAYYYEQNASISSIATLDALVTFGAALILFQSIVPISLVITLEFVRTIQALTIFRDIEMYYEPLNCPAEPKSWNLSDDLGQIEYIFSDKTGTLTQNVMEFQRCSISGIAYGEGVTEAMRGAAKRGADHDPSALDDPALAATHLAESKRKMIDLMKRHFRHRYLNHESLTLISPGLVEDMFNEDPQEEEHRMRMIEFWTSLALCHDVIASKSEGRIEYKAESPDEAALVAAARDLGFVFVKKLGDTLTLEVLGERQKYQLLKIIAFNSSRKRMSSLVRCPDGRIKLICKGADSIIMSRLRSDHDLESKNRTNLDLEAFATAGLRTLLIGSREVSEEEYLKFDVEFSKASEIGGKEREEAIEKVADEFERGLEILGATALEDKLQEGVPEAIEKLHEAGIKLWVLTGDKLQTAIEIGYSCNLLKNTMEIMIISSDTEQGARSQIEQGLEKLMSVIDERESDGREDSLPPRTDHDEPLDGYAVVIDGDTLRYALDSSLKANFLALTVQCETVVCCRVSPAQKALTVKLVKEGRGAMTLAIGDGANDVAMIQEAHIGVGIAGLEGAQASMSADYALGQFRFLTRLLLVHGRWCYIRIADMHANFFFKNIIWTLVLFWYQIYCSFNGSYLFEYTFIMLYNLVFTSLPVGLMGAFEQDLSANASMAFPALYQRGIKGLQYTRSKFWFYMLDGTYQSAVCYWIPYFVYFSSPTVSVTGRDVSIWEFGTTVAVGAVFAANNLIVINTRYFPWFIVIVLTVSSMMVLVWTAIYSGLADYYYKDIVLYTFSTFEFWASFVLVQVLAGVPRMMYKYIQIQYWPKDSDLIREMILGGLSGSDGRIGGIEEEESRSKQIKLVEEVIEKDKAESKFYNEKKKKKKNGTKVEQDHHPIRRSYAATQTQSRSESVEMTAVVETIPVITLTSGTSDPMTPPLPTGIGERIRLDEGFESPPPSHIRTRSRSWTEESNPNEQTRRIYLPHGSSTSHPHHPSYYHQLFAASDPQPLPLNHQSTSNSDDDHDPSGSGLPSGGYVQTSLGINGPDDLVPSPISFRTASEGLHRNVVHR
ncbi:putative aminophospholipid translocase [Melampsora larici-populina 98AG31]|uniref:Phospholipid-transporting ATPase n=1 Tax=Melampsora larici-populina (strain 98AG31 / pathotype 3-4-7) TaxID=747676 RepID=F4S580_MELLP|nr:putative aminophospholipid translocase [Melampsora larici-populina 98AG31]EGG00206.1 putative aminophospholipid translocase [Melampsora larici-populina 98AG31]